MLLRWGYYILVWFISEVSRLMLWVETLHPLPNLPLSWWLDHCNWHGNPPGANVFAGEAHIFLLARHQPQTSFRLCELQPVFASTSSLAHAVELWCRASIALPTIVSFLWTTPHEFFSGDDHATRILSLRPTTPHNLLEWGRPQHDQVHYMLFWQQPHEMLLCQWRHDLFRRHADTNGFSDDVGSWHDCHKSWFCNHDHTTCSAMGCQPHEFVTTSDF